MGAEREQLIKKTFPMLKALCSERSVTLSEVDLRWGITEADSASGETLNMYCPPDPSCLSEVDNCRPYFLCLLGSRYGWAQRAEAEDQLLSLTFAKAEGNFPFVKRFRDRSITELEVRYAGWLFLTSAMERESSRALFFFASHPLASTEPPELQHRLSELKEEIRGLGLPVSNYASPGHLGTMVAEQLRALIDLDFPLTTELSPLSAERQVHLDFAEARRSLYVGRRSAFQWLSAHTTAPCRIIGEEGAGVSAFLANWITDYVLANPSTFVLTHFVDSSQSPTLASMLRRLLSELKEHFGLRRTVPSALAELVTEFPNWLAEAAQSGPVLLLLDAVDRLDDHRQFRWLPLLFPEYLFL